MLYLIPNKRVISKIPKCKPGSLEYQFITHLQYSLAKDEYSATMRDCFKSLALTVRDMLVKKWTKTQQTYHDRKAKRVYYLSMEFMIGRLLENALVNLGIYAKAKKAMKNLGLELDDLIRMESDAALGHGGLGRLAACFLDSMSTLQLPGYGYGIRYEYGIFSQKLEDGYQVEKPDSWLRYGNPWEIERPEYIYFIKFNGRVIETKDNKGSLKYEWVDTDDIIAMAYDIPIPGYKNNTVNNLRLWSAKSTREFNLDYFQKGNYDQAMTEKINSELISKILYPKGDYLEGNKLKLKQEYFLVSATLQDIFRRFVKDNGTNFSVFPDKVKIQLNETHTALAIPELMRIFIDHYNLTWENAWKITQKTVSYTNHTILTEALEQWPVDLFSEILPRHMQIIFEINRQFLEEVGKSSNVDFVRISRTSLIDESTAKKVRMAHLAIVGSHITNGVADIHTEILRERVFNDFYMMYPDRFISITNGITPRRWIELSNPGLTELISRKIGKNWLSNLKELKKLEKYTEDKDFRRKWQYAKKQNKQRLAEYILDQFNIELDPSSFYDCHVKAIHEYKRQLLKLLHIITLYNRIKNNPAINILPRTFIFSGKTAPGYHIAKLIIKLINNVADVINHDKSINDLLKVVYIPNYNVSQAQKIIPAADLSEQISTPGFEASGTGNMKFALNGVITIGTLDGANIEIKQEVGDENIFIFGMSEQGVNHMQKGGYNPRDYYNAIPDLKNAIDAICGDVFSAGSPGQFNPIIDTLLNKSDYYMVLSDYPSYIECQEKIEKTYKNKSKWITMSILNVARVSRFSSDRTIKEYADKIWKVKPVPIKAVK